MVKTLFDCTVINKMNLKNRFFRSALHEGLATVDGHLTPELFKIYQELATGGVGTIITSYTYVSKDGKPDEGLLGIYDDSFIEEYRVLTEMAHQNNTNIMMQIVYGGSQTRQSLASESIWGPSAILNEKSGVTPKEMTKEDIKKLVQLFTDAAIRVKKAGFDGVEIHAAHGYLLSQFLTPYFNRRTDEYGGNIHHRARILYEVYSGIREAVGNDFPIFIKLNCSDFMETGGLTVEESLEVAKRLAELGIDAIELSGGNSSGKDVTHNNLGPVRKKVVISKERESYFRNEAKKLAELIEIPVILVGGNRHLEVMEEILNQTNIQYFSLARPLTTEPDLINRWMSGDLGKPRCVSCNACFGIEGSRCILNQKRKS